MRINHLLQVFRSRPPARVSPRASRISAYPATCFGHFSNFSTTFFDQHSERPVYYRWPSARPRSGVSQLQSSRWRMGCNTWSPDVFCQIPLPREPAPAESVPYPDQDAPQPETGLPRRRTRAVERDTSNRCMSGRKSPQKSFFPTRPASPIALTITRSVLGSPMVTVWGAVCPMNSL